jgi:hypothetical protein
MGTAVNQRAAAVVASPSFVSLSGFGAMSSLLAPRSNVATARFKEGLKESL